VDCLRKHNADVHWGRSKGETLVTLMSKLHTMSSSHAEVVEKLVEKGLGLDEADYFGQSALHWAASVEQRHDRYPPAAS
jgi:ankyrin repeat protein